MLRLLAPIGILTTSALLLWYVFFRPDQTPAPQLAVESLSPDTNWYPDRRWDDRPPGDLNISVFVYRDRNHDGVYDPGDVPMGAVAVLLKRPDGDIRMERSNINGYANFKVSAGNPAIDIGRPDADYRFEVQPPPGWVVTSGNATQTARFDLLTGSPAGMVTATPPAVIGLAPVLTISGSVGASATHMTGFALEAPDGRMQQLDIAPDGRFSAAAHAGPWRLIARHDGGDTHTLREFEVADAPVALGVISVETSRPSAKPHAITVDFEGFDRSIIEKLATGYMGLDWDYLLAIDNQHYRGPGYANVLAGGSAVGYNSSGYPVTVRSLTPGERFDFVGAYFSVAWPQAEGEMLTLEAWRGDEPVHSDRIRLSHLGPVWFQADYRDIDRLRLTTDHYWQFTTDEMRFRLAQAPPR
jgi:hypothetical protein